MLYRIYFDIAIKKIARTQSHNKPQLKYQILTKTFLNWKFFNPVKIYYLHQ